MIRGLQDQSCSTLLKILADENRLSIIIHLLDKSLLVNEISSDLNLEQSLTSHHLKILREGGFVSTKRDGKGIRYSLSPQVIVNQDNETINLGCCKLSFTAEK